MTITKDTLLCEKTDSQLDLILTAIDQIYNTGGNEHLIEIYTFCL